MSRHVMGMLVCAAALAACGTMPPMKIDAQHDPAAAATLRTYRTYGWLPRSGAGPAMEEAIGPAVTRQVDETLGGKGYRPDASRPDFLVTWHVSVAGKEQTTTFDTGPRFMDRRPMPGMAPAAPPVKVTRQYTEGTLVLDVVDPGTGRVVWRGSAEAEIVASADPRTREARIGEAVRRVLERFPPK